VHTNPLNARLVDRAEAYRWSSARYLFRPGLPASFDRDALIRLLGFRDLSPYSVGRVVDRASASEYEALPEVGRLVKGDQEFAVGRIEAAGRVHAPWKGASETVVVAAISQATGVGVEAMLGRSRDRAVVDARTLAAYVGKRYAGVSLYRTARHLGREDSCLSRPVALLEQRLEKEPMFRRQIERLISRLRRITPAIAESRNQD
jgi:hypothetical protein